MRARIIQSVAIAVFTVAVLVSYPLALAVRMARVAWVVTDEGYRTWIAQVVRIW